MLRFLKDKFVSSFLQTTLLLANVTLRPPFFWGVGGGF